MMTYSSPTFLDVDVGLDVDRALVRVLAAGLRIEMLDDLDEALERLHVDRQRLRELHEVALHEHVPVIADDDLDERLVDLEEVELQQQALAKVARADADRIEDLDGLDGLRCFFGRVGSRGLDLLHAGAQVAVLVDVADDERADLLDARRRVGHAQLPREVIGEVRRTGEGVLDRELLVLLRHPRVVAVLDVVLEVGVVVDLVEGVLLLVLRRVFDRLRRFVGVGLLIGGVGFGLFGLRFFGGFFEERVLEQLLVEDFLELEFRQLQQLDRLLQRRRHDQLLREF